MMIPTEQTLKSKFPQCCAFFIISGGFVYQISCILWENIAQVGQDTTHLLQMHLPITNMLYVLCLPLTHRDQINQILTQCCKAKYNI